MRNKITKVLCAVLTLVMLFTSLSVLGVTVSAAETQYIDNSSLLPKWYAANKDQVDERGAPYWIKELTTIMGCRISTATPEGTLESAVKVLDHCAEMGINGLWVLPINDNPSNQQGYYNIGPHTIDPRITGVIGYDEPWRKTDYEEGWNIFKKFVDEAHKRNIRIILDIVSWGTVEGEFTKEHADWYQLGNGLGGAGTKNFIYTHEGAIEWFAQTVADIAEKTGVDGLRYDMEPTKFGYPAATAIREKLAKKGIYIASFSEGHNERGTTAYDFEEYGVSAPDAVTPSTYPQNLYLNGYNMADDVKTGQNVGSPYSQRIGQGGQYQYYTMMLSCHDFYSYPVSNNKLAFGYQAIYSPYIPIWYIGEEWNNKSVPNGLPGRGSSSLLFGSKIDWDLMNVPENRNFFESVKGMLRLRLSYPEIFNYYPEDHTTTNICEVEVIGQDHLYSYARYADNKGLIVLSNDNAHNVDGNYKVYVPLTDMELDYYENYTIKNLTTGKIVAEGTAKDIRTFKATVKPGEVDVYEVTGGGKREVPEGEDDEEFDDEEFDDDYFDDDYFDDDYFDDDNLIGGEPEDDEKQVVTIHRKKKLKNPADFPLGFVIGGGAAAVIAVGGLVWFLLAKNRKKKDEDSVAENVTDEA